MSFAVTGYLAVFEIDKQIAVHHNVRSSQPVEPATRKSGIQSTQEVQNPPVQNGQSRSTGPVQVSSSLQSGHAQQGYAIRQRQGDLTHTSEDSPFLSGGVRLHNSNDNLSTLPTALRPSNSTDSLPNGSTQQSPRVKHIAPPDVDKDE